MILKFKLLQVFGLNVMIYPILVKLEKSLYFDRLSTTHNRAAADSLPNTFRKVLSDLG